MRTLPSSRRTERRLVIGALAALLTFSGCAAAGSGSAKNTPVITTELPAASGQAERVTWALYNEPASLDPIKPADFPPQQVMTNVCESLLKLTPEMTIEANLAESWENPEPTVWVYRLRDDVAFHSGAPMTAEDVAFSLNRAANYDLGSMVAGAFDLVKSIEATGPLEVTVTLKQPDVAFHQEMATNSGRILNKESTEAAGESLGTPSTHADCTGPFQLTEWKPGEQITIERFPGYWDAAHAARTDVVDFVFVRDAASRVNGMLSGEIDGSWNIPPSGFAKLTSGGKGELFFGKTSGGLIAMVTSLTGGLADQRVRQALSMSIDREGLVHAAASGAADPLYTVASSGSWGYERETFRAAADKLAAATGSFEEAKELVAEAGPQPPITIAATSAQPEMPVVAAEIQRAAEALGLEVTITTLPEDTYNSLFSDPKAREGIDLMFSVWQTYYPDPISLYNYLTSDAFYNYAGWSNPEFDKLVLQARETNNEKERAKLVIAAQQLAADDPTWIPIYQPYNPVYLTNGLTGVPTAAIQHNIPWASGLGTGESTKP